MNKPNVAATALGLLLPPCALLAFAGPHFKDQNTSAVPLIALCALVSVLLVSGSFGTERETGKQSTYFFSAVIVGSLVVAVLRAAL